MADKRIIQLPDTPGLDTTTDEMVVDNATDGARRVPVGRAGGVATLGPNGELVQPGRVVELKNAVGITSYPSTTAVVGQYILPDPQITMDVEAGDIILLTAAIILYVDAAAGWGFARYHYSTDAGVTWTGIGTFYAAQSPSANIRFSLALNHVVVISSPGTYTFGISIGNPGGSSNTVTAHGTYRELSAMRVVPAQ
ncbi:hypothetical protein [Oceanithermus sp.]|uniref:hypothetical protein n=1 Tax=Oceanithermus sp. TaxID=2268145 RepID=UPI00257F5BE5|nr:hypothetical protein [Oceanithermus sp.]